MTIPDDEKCSVQNEERSVEITQSFGVGPFYDSILQFIPPLQIERQLLSYSPLVHVRIHNLVFLEESDSVDHPRLARPLGV